MPATIRTRRRLAIGSRIQPESFDRGPTRCRETDQFTEVKIPGEVFWPVICSRIEEPRIPQGNGVHSRRLVVFQIVAPLAGEREILLDAVATGIERDDVLDREGIR